MIKKLKRRFIMLAMASLIVMLSVIVAGMNILNYNSVVSSADDTLEMLSNNRGRLPLLFDDDYDDYYDGYYEDMGDIFESMMPRYDTDDDTDDNTDSDSDTGDGPKAPYYKEDRGGRAPSWMSRDEAEETRYFTVLEDSSGNAVVINTDRIYAVDGQEAVRYADKAIASGHEKGFMGDYRYAVSDEGSYTRVTFLDCGRSLDAFREFLRASILMSIVGLLLLFAVICYFAGRIVRPVAESYEKQKRFITDAGHEIKTPLAIIKANIDIMRMDIEDLEEAAGVESELDPEQTCRDIEEAGTEASSGQDDTDASSLIKAAGSLNESLSDIDGQVDRLTTLTNDLVYLSRMEEDGNTLTMTEIPVSDIVSETVDSFDALAQEKKKTIAADITPMLSMNGSSKEIEKLVSILTENALKYSPEGDTIGVSLTREGKNIVLEVRNRTHNPVKDEDLAHVFERFYRTDKSRNSAEGGHGIGLSVASAIVTAHNGKIRARSGDGNEFIVTAAMPAK